ncbi:MAG: ABC transporter ATP-binding protein [Zhaonellaceae bacterium]|jgi:ATP-binding cassette subfamily B multidrug efflux pump
MSNKKFQVEMAEEKAFDFHLMKRLLAYIKPYIFQMAVTILLLVLVTLADLARPYLIKLAIDNHLTAFASNTSSFKEHAGALLRLVLFYLLLIAASFGLNYSQALLLEITGQRIIYTLRKQVFNHLLKLDIAFFDANPVGRLVTRVTNDIQNLQEMYSGVIITLFKDFFLLAGIIIVMLRLHTVLALVSFAVIPLILLATIIYQLYARQAFRAIRANLAQVNSFLQEHLSGMSIIQSFNKEDFKYEEFKKYNRKLHQANMDELLSFSTFRPSMDLMYALALALLIWYGGGKVIQGSVSFGVLYAFINYIEQFFHPINDLTEKYSILQSAMASAERIFSLLDTKPTITEPASPQILPSIKGKIEFDHVWFAYQGEDWVLKDISFTVEPGQTFALVGATGAGKTSVINLLNRLYDVQKGEIRIDGIPIKDIPLTDLRRFIGVVMQDVFIFAGDVAENISLGNPKLSLDDIKKAAEYVHANHFIERLPKGYKEPVTERGATFSTGERQLLAFARALAYNPAILVLDEATANIDTETELLIQDALKKLTAQRTTLIVAHRLSTIQHADCILVFHHGRLVEAGPHQELLAKRGRYYQLYRLQYQEVAEV